MDENKDIKPAEEIPEEQKKKVPSVKEQMEKLKSKYDTNISHGGFPLFPS